MNFRPYSCKDLCYQSIDPNKMCYCDMGYNGYCCGHYHVCCNCNEFNPGLCTFKPPNKKPCGKLIKSFCYPSLKLENCKASLADANAEYHQC